MDFFKRNKTFLLILFTCLLFLQQIAVHYRLTRASKVDENGYDTLVLREINQLEKLWQKADVADLVTPEKMANLVQLEEACIRLKRAEIEIQESENRVRSVKGKRREFFQKAYAYYHHSSSSLLEIINFLLAKKGKYSVKGNEISFESDTDAESFRVLIQQLSYLDQEKKDLDAYIINHNRRVEKKLLIR